MELYFSYLAVHGVPFPVATTSPPPNAPSGPALQVTLHGSDGPLRQVVQDHVERLIVASLSPSPSDQTWLRSALGRDLQQAGIKGWVCVTWTARQGECLMLACSETGQYMMVNPDHHLTPSQKGTLPQTFICDHPETPCTANC